MANDELEVEKGPAVAGPADAQQPVDQAELVVSTVSVPADPGKVYNVGDTEISVQAQQNEVEDAK